PVGEPRPITPIETPAPVAPTVERVAGQPETAVVPPAAAPAVPIPEPKPKRTGRPVDLFQFIKRNGGVQDPQGELATILDPQSKAYRDLVNPKGKSLDDMVSKAAEEGYYGQRDAE